MEEKFIRKKRRTKSEGGLQAFSQAALNHLAFYQIFDLVNSAFNDCW